MAKASAGTERATELAAQPITYSKARLLAHKRYARDRDALSALLSDGDRYTIKQVDDLLQKFKKGKVT